MDNTMNQKVYNVEADVNEIKLVSLFSALLRSWKVLLIWGVIFCLLGATFQVYRTRKDDEAYEKSYEEYYRQLSNYNEAVSAYDRERKAVQADIEDIYSYIEQSVLLKINPYKEAYATADLLFDEDDDAYSLILGDKLSVKNEKADRLVGIYMSFLENGISYQEIAERFGTEDRFIRELVGFVQVPENGNLRIFVRHTNQENAGIILDYVLEKIAEQRENAADEIPEHSYAIINKAVRERVDTSLITQVEELRSGTAVVRNVNSLYSKQLALVDDFNARIEAIDEKMENLTEPVSVETGTQRGILTFAVIGLIGGVLLGAILRALRLMLGGKLLDRQPLMLRFGLRLLAAFPHGGRSVFNRLADRLLVAETGLSQDEVYTVAVNSIRRWTEDKKSSILLAAGREMKEEVCRALRDGLAEKDQTDSYQLVQAFGNNLHTQQALETCDYVVLLAQIGKTRQESIEHILNITEQYGKTVMGVILYN